MTEAKDVFTIQAKVADVKPYWEQNTFARKPDDTSWQAWKLKRVILLEPHSQSEKYPDNKLTCFGRAKVRIGKGATYIFSVVAKQGDSRIFVNVEAAVLVEGSGVPEFPEIPPVPTDSPSPSGGNGHAPVPGTDNAARVRGMALHRAVESWTALICHDKASIARTKLGMNLNGSEKELILALADIAEKEKFPGDK